MSNPSSAAAGLQSQWHTLHDLDRARAVNAIHQAGTSLRELAKTLNCSDSLLRRLLAALQAPLADRLLLRQGKISTNELVRCSKAAGIRRSSMHRETREFERTQASRQACRTICGWLAAEQMSGPYCEQIVDEARRQLAIAGMTGKFPKDAAPPDMPAEEIIQCCRPPQAGINELSSTAWFGAWLARWTYYAFTDTTVRDTALDLALEEQFRI
jgi:transposase-like protein